MFRTGHHLDIPVVHIAGLSVVGAGAGATLSVASAAIPGGVEPSHAGMASAIEGVSYEFGALISIAVPGSLQATLYGVRAPTAAGDGVDGHSPEDLLPSSTPREVRSTRVSV